MPSASVAAPVAESKRDSPRKRRTRHRVEKPVLTELPKSGLLQLSSFVPSPMFDMGRSTWWKLVAEKVAPQPVRLKPGGTFWRAEDLAAFLKSLSNSG